MKTGDLVYWMYDIRDGARTPLIYLGRSAKQVHLAITMQPNGQITIRWVDDLKFLP
jgi:hypothetical protein